METPRVFLYNTVRHAVDCPVLSPTVSHVFATLRATPAADISFVICLVHTSSSSSSCAEGTTYCAPLPFHRRGRLLRYYTLSPVRRTGRARASVEPQLSRNRRFRWRAGCIQLHGGILPPPAPNNTPIPLHPPSLGAMRRLLTRAGRLGREAPVLPPPRERPLSSSAWLAAVRKRLGCSCALKCN